MKINVPFGATATLRFMLFDKQNWLRQHKWTTEYTHITAYKYTHTHKGAKLCRIDFEYFCAV